jgi:hypothetical protein
MVVDPYARSAEASRIVHWRLPICAAIVSYSVRYSLWRDLGTLSEALLIALEFDLRYHGVDLSQAM